MVCWGHELKDGNMIDATCHAELGIPDATFEAVKPPDPPLCHQHSDTTEWNLWVYLGKGILLNSNKQEGRIDCSIAAHSFITIGWQINERSTHASNWFPKIAEKLSQGSTVRERCIRAPYGNTSFMLLINFHFKSFSLSSEASHLPHYGKFIYIILKVSFQGYAVTFGEVLIK